MKSNMVARQRHGIDKEMIYSALNEGVAGVEVTPLKDKTDTQHGEL